MKTLMRAFVFASIVLSFNFAQAAGKVIWRDCGIGAMIFKKTDWAAVTSNVIWDLGTTATTSYASSEDQCMGQAANTAKFIQGTYANLEEETAAGQGQHLTTVLNIMGCEASAHKNIINDLRSGMGQVVVQPNRTDKAQAYYDLLMKQVQSKHSASCSINLG